VKTYLVRRDVDETGNSGTGFVAEACRFEDGTTIVHWNKRTNAIGTTSTVVYSSFEDAVKVHGHNGKTVFVEQKQGFEGL
jgi:hypothetical protein